MILLVILQKCTQFNTLVHGVVKGLCGIITQFWKSVTLRWTASPLDVNPTLDLPLMSFLISFNKIYPVVSKGKSSLIYFQVW